MTLGFDEPRSGGGEQAAANHRQTRIVALHLQAEPLACRRHLLDGLVQFQSLRPRPQLPLQIHSVFNPVACVNLRKIDQANRAGVKRNTAHAVGQMQIAMKPMLHIAGVPLSKHARQAMAERLDRCAPSLIVTDVIGSDVVGGLMKQLRPILLPRFRVDGERLGGGVKARGGLNESRNVVIVPVQALGSVGKLLDHDPRQVVAAQGLAARVQPWNGNVAG